MEQHRIKIFGPPGSGKTRYCLDLLCEHLQAGDRVLFLSFTRAAVEEARNRLIGTFGSVPEHAATSTIHSLCLKILDLKPAHIFDINGGKEEFCASMGIASMNIRHEQFNRVEQAMTYQQYLQNADSITCPDYRGFPFIDPIGNQEIITKLEAFKRMNGYNSFNDTLLRVAQGEGTVSGNDVVIIDEAQDLTALQWKVVERLYRRASHVYVVGDDDQNLYAYMGANVNAFLLWPSSAIRVLGVTHRLPKNVLDYSLKIARQIYDRQPKEIKAVKGDGVIIEGVPQLWYLNYGVADSELFLTRNKYNQKEICEHLYRNGVPYRSEHSPFTSGTYAGRVMKAINTVHHWRDKALSLQDWKLLKKVMGRGRKEFVTEIERDYPGATTDLPEGIPSLRSIRQNWDFVTPGWYEIFFPILVPSLRDLYRRSLAKYTLAECLNPKIEVSTVHGAKGREADRVYVCSAMTNYQRCGLTKEPGVRSAEAEHRIFYVAVTRTKRELILLNDPNAGTNKYYFPNV